MIPEKRTKRRQLQPYDCGQGVASHNRVWTTCRLVMVSHIQSYILIYVSITTIFQQGKAPPHNTPAVHSLSEQQLQIYRLEDMVHKLAQKTT